MARATVLSAMIGVVVFGAVRLASARDGVPGSARTWVTFAGVVSGLPGDPRTANMRFSFHRSGAGGADAGVPPSLCAPTVRDVSISTTGAFSAQIPLDDPSSSCPADLFDGRDVQIDIDVGAETVLRNAPVNPVPYAHFASNSGNAKIAERVRGLQVAQVWMQVDETVAIGASPRWTGTGVSSITHIAAGRWRVVFSTPFASAGYAIGMSASRADWLMSWAINEATSIEVRISSPVAGDGGIGFQYITSGSAEVPLMFMGPAAP